VSPKPRIKSSLKSSISMRNIGSVQITSPGLATQRPRLAIHQSHHSIPAVQSLRNTAMLAALFSAQTTRVDTLPTSHCYNVRVVIFSNYGDPNYVKCSEIDIFDVNNNKVDVFNVTVDSDEEEVPAQNLTNGEYNSSDRKNDWYCKWLGKPITIVFSVSCRDKLGYLRIWNGVENPEQNMKDIQICVGDRFIVNKTVPQNIGTNISIKAEEEIQLEYCLKKQAKRYCDFYKDGYGEIPNIVAHTIDIDLYGEKDTFVGLNQIEIFDSKGHRIRPDGKEITISTEGFRSMFTAMNLFKENKNTCDYTEMWSAAIMGSYGTLRITFNIETAISFISVFNHNSCYPETMYQSSKARIRINGDTIWRGRFRKAHGISKGISK